MMTVRDQINLFCRRSWFVSTIALCALAGCDSDSASTPKSESALTPVVENYRIAVVPKGTNHEFWKSIHAGAEKAGFESPGVQIIWKGPVKETDREQQINIIDTFVTTHVSGIVMAPLDEKALVRPATQAMQAGIPVVIMDSGLNTEPGEGYISFVATDNNLGGRLAAKKMGVLLGGQGDVIVLRYMQGSASTTAREDGFLAGLTEEFPEIRVISSDQHAGPTTESAYAIAETLLQRYPDVDGIFAPCEPAVFGILRALEAKRLAGKVMLVGFDPSAKLIEAMQGDKLQGLVLQDPYKIGYLAVKTMVSHLHGEAVDPRIDTGCTLATPANMHEPRIAELLSPPTDSQP